jgi:uracil-DNA glycosylase family 4
MIIGESPSELDDRTEKHFQGRPGKLLDEMLAAAGLDRKDCYLTYVVKCHTPEGRAPSSKEAKTCKENYLLKEIADVQPQYILTLGATALKAITKKAKITEMHGQMFHFGTIPVIPTFSPAMALRDPTRLPTLRKDFVKLGHIMVGNVPDEAAMHWEVIRTLKQWNEFILEFRQSKVSSADLETTGLDPYDPDGKVNSIQIGLDNGKNYAIPLNVMWSPWSPDRQQMFIETLVEIADETGMIIVGQNFKFDNKWLMEKYGVKFYVRFDVMLAHHILDENSPHGLKELASEYCNAPTYDIPLRIKLGKFKNHDEEEKFFKYGCFDVHYTLQLYKIFRAKLLREQELRKLFYRVTMPAARLFEEIEANGLFINMKALAAAKTKLTIEAAQLRAKLDAMVVKAGAQSVNWNAPAQVGRFFFTDLGLEVLEKTDGGAPSTAESVMLRLKSKHPAAALLLELRGVEKNLSTYVEGWEKLMHGDRLYLSTKIHGTVTGRFSSRLHQVPRIPFIRSLIDAPEGWTFVQADYSQIELRIAAMLANEPRMKMIFQTGGDIHKTTASAILGIPEDQLTKEQRKMAKAVNFGLVYGMGWPKLVIYARDNYEVDLTDDQAMAFRKRFFELYSGLLAWHERMRRIVRATGEVHSLSGRVRHLPGINSTDKGVRAEAERQGINAPVQGFGSGDLKTMSMIEIREEFDPDDVLIKGEVHDSVLMWVRTEKLAEVLPRVKQIMESPKLLEIFGINITVPIVVDIETGPWGSGEPFRLAA